MDEIFQIVAAVIGTLLLLILLVIGVLIYLRAKKPHSKKIAAEQAELNKKMIGTGLTTTTDTPTTQKDWPLANKWLTLLIVIVGIALSLWQYDAKVSTATVGTWGQDHWSSLVIAALVVEALIALNAKALGAFAAKLQWKTPWVVLFFVLGLPIIGWANMQLSTYPPTEMSKAVKALPVLTVGPQESSEFLTAGIDGGRIKFKSAPGENFETRCVYTDGSEGIVGNVEHPCKDGPMRYRYVKNLTDKTIHVTYQVVR